MSQNFVEMPNNAKNSDPVELKKQLVAKLQDLHQLSDAAPLVRARLQLDVAESLVALERKAEAWTLARAALATALHHAAWQEAVEACDVLFQCGQKDSIAALGMGVWLAVSFPVNPESTLAMLIHVVDETPNDCDDAALAAMTARYVVDLRAADVAHESLSFLADNLLAHVAKRHGKVRDQITMDQWINTLELRDPQIFLPRLSKVVDKLVGDAWWFDRDELRAKFD